ncbi:hypothetical protein LWC33_13070 [Pseudonocardia sp. RS11V-5]|uniref:hypothetical protein n=1 Tax=Pseudonocardia terrae TaxID=2905831 RepID=UPI001E35171E|nr:hypothetical protein [Pseudonocardia terrae]MCE3552389.1 hypothetical protein [Pseudonocardia terrae]
MSAPGELFVDFDELGRIQQELSTLIGALSELGSRRAPLPGDEIGAREVADAVGHFEQSWQGGRDQLIENLRACQEYAALALEHYTKTETMLEDTMDGGAS